MVIEWLMIEQSWKYRIGKIFSLESVFGMLYSSQIIQNIKAK